MDQLTIIPISGIPYAYRPVTNIVPFSEQDGSRYLEVLYDLKRFLNDTVITHINTEVGELAESWKATTEKLIGDVEEQLATQTADVDGKITSLEDYVDEAVNSIVGSTIVVVDPVMKTVIANLTSQTRVYLDTLYAGKSVQTLTETGRLSASALDAAYASKTTQTAVESGRLAKAALDGDYSAKSTQTTVETGRLSATAMKRGTVGANGLYMPRPYALNKWNVRKVATIGKRRQSHIAFVGDSILFGATTTKPYPSNNVPGRFKEMLDSIYGSAGSGIINMIDTVVADNAIDPRIAFTGGPVITAWGIFKQGAVKLLPNSVGKLFIAGDCDETTVFNLSSSSGVCTATSGGVVQRFRVAKGSGTTVVENDPTYHQIVTRLPWGSVANRTVELTSIAATGDFYPVAVEARINKLGTFRVTNASDNGQSLNTLFAGAAYNDEVNGFFGLPMIDMLRADLLVIGLGINDWQAATPIATFKASLTTLIRRQRQGGLTSAGFSPASGEAMLLWHAQPSIATLQPVGGPTWEEYRTALYEVADEQIVPLLDLGLRYDNFNAGNALGMFGDGIHLNDLGSLDEASAVFGAIMTNV